MLQERIYPQYNSLKVCGGQYSLLGKVCEWQVAREEDGVAVRIYGDYRHEGKTYRFGTRIEALEALPAMIYMEVS